MDANDTLTIPEALYVMEKLGDQIDYSSPGL